MSALARVGQGRLVRCLQLAVSVGVLVGGWWALLAWVTDIAGRQPEDAIRLHRFGSAFLQFCLAFLGCLAVVQLPAMVFGVRGLVRYFQTQNKAEDKNGDGLMGMLIGLITRWRLRVFFLAAATVVLCGASLVMVVASIQWRAAREALRTQSPSRQLLHQAYGHFDGTALRWALVCGVLAYLSVQGIGMGGFIYLPVRYHYKSSPRPGRALALGLSTGLNGLALTVVVTPVVLAVFEVALGQGAVGRFAEDRSFGWLGRRLDLLARFVWRSPGEAALVLLVVPLACAVVISRSLRRFETFDSAEWALAPDFRPALYLRSWEADRIRVRAPALRRGAVEHFAPPRRMTFAELVAESSERQAPVLAVGEPEGRRLPGVGSMTYADDAWQDGVRAHAARALCVVMTAGAAPADSGYAWELELVGSGDVTQRLAVVFPPGLTLSQAMKPGGFLGRAAELPAFQELCDMELTDETLVLARSRQRGWKAYSAGVRNDGAYCLQVMNALDHFTDDWEADLQESQSAPEKSVDRILRDQLTFGFVENATMKVVGGVVRVLRSGAGRRLRRRFAGKVGPAPAVSAPTERQTDTTAGGG